MTLHRHEVDGRNYVNDGSQPLHLPSGWQIAEGNADDVRVCGAHAWQSHGLVFANGDMYGTAVSHDSSVSYYTGAARRAKMKIKFCLTHENRETNEQRQSL
jgi:hypothetical protein